MVKQKKRKEKKAQKKKINKRNSLLNKNFYLISGLILIFLLIGLILIYQNPNQETEKEAKKSEVPEQIPNNNEKIFFGETEQTNIKNWNSYYNPLYNFRIKYPNTWKKEKIWEKHLVDFVPDENQSQEFSANINIIAKKMQDSDLEKIVDSYLKEIKENVGSAEILNVEKGKINGLPAYAIIFKGRVQAQKLKWLAVWTSYKDTAYNITYISKLEKYAKFLKEAKQTIKSFDIVVK